MIKEGVIQGSMIPRRLLLIGAPALALSACGKDLLGPPEPGPIYPVRPTFAAAKGEKVSWALAILRPDVPGGLDSDRIALTQTDGSLDYYAKATYPDRVSPIVQQALLDGFEASGRIDAVAPEQTALHADYNLVTEVKDFAAHYSQPDGIPSVTVTLTAKLTTTHGRAIVSTFTATQTATASANSAAAAAQVLQQALGTCVTQIVGWTLSAPRPPQTPSR
jgi:cholesterol transport system auxiliary component